MHTINVVQRHNRNFLAIHLCVTNNRFWLICANDLTRIWSKFICVTIAHIKHNKQSNDDYYSRYMNSYCHFVWFSIKSDFRIISPAENVGDGTKIYAVCKNEKFPNFTIVWH